MHRGTAVITIVLLLIAACEERKESAATPSARSTAAATVTESESAATKTAPSSRSSNDAAVTDEAAASQADPDCLRWILFYSGADGFAPVALKSKKACDRNRRENLEADQEDGDGELIAPPCTCATSWRASEAPKLRTKVHRKRAHGFRGKQPYEDNECMKSGLPTNAYEYSGSVVSDLLAVAGADGCVPRTEYVNDKFCCPE